MSASWSLRDLRQARKFSESRIICRTGTAGSLALVESAGSETAGTGRTLSGVASVFGEWQEIRSSAEGHFMERIAATAFKKTLAESRGRVPLLLDHGLHPQLGSMLIGELRSLSADATGLHYEAELHRGVPELLQEGLAAGQYGSSFRAREIKSSWNRRPEPSRWNPEGIPEVTRVELMLLDLGPTALPAYAATSARLRAALPPDGPRHRFEVLEGDGQPGWLLQRDDGKRPSWYLGDLRRKPRPAWQLERKERHGHAYARKN